MNTSKPVEFRYKFKDKTWSDWVDVPTVTHTVVRLFQSSDLETKVTVSDSVGKGQWRFKR